MNKKIFFVAHSYHRKTKSYLFLSSYLEEFFDVDVFFDDSWTTGKAFDYASKVSESYFACVFFQMIPSREVLNSLKCRNHIFFPMYDFSFKWDYSKWLEYRDVKIFSFSKTLFDKLTLLGFNCEYARYFIEPRVSEPGDENGVFFWQRADNIDLKTVMTLFEGRRANIHVHRSPDPGSSPYEPTDDEKKKYSMTFSKWFDDPEDMRKVAESKAFYISPRMYEGIGMGFLGAMSMGKIVVANNAPTMNEYIVDSQNGFLRDFSNPKPIPSDFDIAAMRRRVIAFAKEGYERWLEDRKKIVDFINADSKPMKNPPLLERVRRALLLNKPLRMKLGRRRYLYIFGVAIIKKREE